MQLRKTASCRIQPYVFKRPLPTLGVGHSPQSDHIYVSFGRLPLLQNYQNSIILALTLFQRSLGLVVFYYYDPRFVLKKWCCFKARLNNTI